MPQVCALEREYIHRQQAFHRIKHRAENLVGPCWEDHEVIESVHQLVLILPLYLDAQFDRKVAIPLLVLSGPQSVVAVDLTDVLERARHGHDSRLAVILAGEVTGLEPDIHDLSTFLRHG